jgi:drug/metabolite transporter (DMT)-like permease
VPRLAIGLILACLAASFYDLAIALQALDARAQSAVHGLRPSLIGTLAKRRRWLAATILGLAGWPVQVAALLFAPLTVVQPALAFGLLLLLVAGVRILDEPVGKREIAAVAAIIAGIGGLAWASPNNSHANGTPGHVAIALASVALLAMVPYALAERRRATGGGHGDHGSIAIVLSAGLAFAWTGLSSKLLADALHHGSTGAAVIWGIATALVAFVGLLSEMTALQQRPATAVAPIVFTVQVIVPVALSPLIGQPWDSAPAGGAAIIPFLAILTAGAVLLSGSAPVAGMVTAAEGEIASENRDWQGISR